MTAYLSKQGGADTNYQAIALINAANLLHTGYRAEQAQALFHAWQKGGRWLAQRINEDGSIDSSGNTRTCNGNEEFLGKTKQASPARVFEALAYVGVQTGDVELLNAADRVSKWVQSNSSKNPCAP